MNHLERQMTPARAPTETFGARHVSNVQKGITTGSLIMLVGRSRIKIKRKDKKKEKGREKRKNLLETAVVSNQCFRLQREHEIALRRLKYAKHGSESPSRLGAEVQSHVCDCNYHSEFYLNILNARKNTEKSEES